MIETIAKTGYYELSVDPERNRIYLTFTGSITTKAAISNFVEDCGKAIGRVTPGFTMLTDLTRMETPAIDTGRVFFNAQVMCVECGLSRVAEVMRPGILELMTERHATMSHMNRRAFRDITEAERWLDST